MADGQMIYALPLTDVTIRIDGEGFHAAHEHVDLLGLSSHATSADEEVIVITARRKR